MKEKLIDLFEYTYHFNNEMIQVISKNREAVDDKTISLINIPQCTQIWNARISRETTFEVWQINPFDTLEEINHQNFLKSIAIVQNADLEKTIEYQIQEEQNLKIRFLKCFSCN
jgi:hypothetical protein